MIDHISIRNFAIIDNTEIDLEDGLNVITGETGAGKSIVIQAVSLALGARADSSFIRHGEEKAYVELAAGVGGDDFVISREVSLSGRNICRINGRLATLGEVQELAHKIADIHGQYDNQLLLDPVCHLELVDAYRPAQTGPALKDFGEAYDRYKSIRTDLDTLIKTAEDSKRKKDFYEFEIKEIDGIAPKPGEDKELEDRISILENSEAIYNALNTSRSMLDADDSGILAMLGAVQENLGRISRFSEQLKKLSDDLSDASFTIQSAADEMRGICEITDFSPAELDRAIARLEEIDELKKKYGPSIDDVISYRGRIAEELDVIENFDDRKRELKTALESARKVLMEKADVLTEVRKESAALLGSAILAELRDLNFSDSELMIDVRKAAAITRTGADEAEILLSANRGEPLKPLSRIASGGEISRIMLAIKNVTGSRFDVPTMIFDEIDAGISGITASVVARKLKSIAKSHQIVCITHLPQIAAAGTSNYRIYKESDETSTYTHVQRLDGEEKTYEIARLLGGENITPTTLASAGELIRSMK